MFYPNELEVQDTTDIQWSASYLDHHLTIDNGGRINLKRYNKHDDFTFPMVNFPFISSNIPGAPTADTKTTQASLHCS